MEFSPMSIFGHSFLTPMTPERQIELNKIFLDDNGFLKMLPASIYQNSCTKDELKLWCHMNGIYQLPTTELIDFISKHITGKAIEIGCGNGSIGRSLGIPITDLKLQEKNEFKKHYLDHGQPVVTYPKDVLEMEAGRAINKLKPDTVIGCWVTEWSKTPTGQSSYWGIDECNILQGKKYIFVGNLNIHDQKKILKYKHDQYQFPWIVSRAKNPENNVIWVWEKF